MTVCANHVTLRDLVEHGLPGAVTKTLGDFELVSEVVELERIELTTVDARSLTEELDEIRRALRGERIFAAHGFRHVAFSVPRVVLLFVCGATRAAVVVKLPATNASPGELRSWLELAATPAPAQTWVGT